MPTSVSPALDHRHRGGEQARAAVRIVRVSCRLRRRACASASRARSRRSAAAATTVRHDAAGRRAAAASTRSTSADEDWRRARSGVARPAAERALRADRAPAPAAAGRAAGRGCARARAGAGRRRGRASRQRRPRRAPATSPTVRDPARVQLRGGDRPDAPQPLDRQRVQERELAVRRHDQQAVGLGHAAGDLGEELRARDADRDRQADLARAPAARSRAAISRGVPRDPLAGRARRGTPRRSTAPRPAASCRRRPRTPPCSPRE